MFELATLAGVDPWPYTLRELKWMADEALAHAWNHTSAVCAMIANTVRDPKKRARPYTPGEFHPVELARKRSRPKVPITVLRDVFVDRKLPHHPEVRR